MNILVTGCTGAVGSPLTRELQSRGYEVTGCDLRHSHQDWYSRCDTSSYTQLDALFDERGPFDLVYHLAAEFGRWNGEDFYENLWRTNVIGTKHLIRQQERRRFRMVMFSSSEIYGDYDGLMVEDVPDRLGIRQMNDYAMTKWVNEMQVLNSAEMYDTETVRVRLFNTYGPGEYYSEYRSVTCRFIYCALHNLPYTVYLDHHRTSSYIEDTVRTLANITERFTPGEVYNIAGTEYHDMKLISDLILDYLGKADDLIAYRDREPQTTRDKRVEVGKAIRDLGHESRVTLAEGIPRTIEWMRKVYRDTIVAPARRERG